MRWRRLGSHAVNDLGNLSRPCNACPALFACRLLGGNNFGLGPPLPSPSATPSSPLPPSPEPLSPPPSHAPLSSQPPPSLCLRFYGYTVASGVDAGGYAPLTEAVYTAIAIPCGSNNSCSGFAAPNGCEYSKRGAAPVLRCVAASDRHGS
jgi:hypothetical protein